jgi:hypothetical protein
MRCVGHSVEFPSLQIQGNLNEAYSKQPTVSSYTARQSAAKKNSDIGHRGSLPIIAIPASYHNAAHIARARMGSVATRQSSISNPLIMLRTEVVGKLGV